MFVTVRLAQDTGWAPRGFQVQDWLGFNRCEPIVLLLVLDSGQQEDFLTFHEVVSRKDLIIVLKLRLHHSFCVLLKVIHFD